MSTEISWVLEVSILPGKIEDFLAVAKELVASSKKEKGTEIYEWFLSEDGTHCHIYERYKDSAAVITHVGSFGTFATRFLAACRPVRFNVYGTPDEEVKKALADLGPAYHVLKDGFAR